MRLWSLHPEYLDAKGLVALWREVLLARKVLKGETKGYAKHPQLLRFNQSENSLFAIDKYLHQVWIETDKRGYCFDNTKFEHHENNLIIIVTTGQLQFELTHMKNKLINRDPDKYNEISTLKFPQQHRLFSIINGEVESWEIVS